MISDTRWKGGGWIGLERDGLLWTSSWNFEFREIQGIFRLAKKLLASQKGLKYPTL